MKTYKLHPLDTLFFRDARPMTAGAGSGGHGANWPLPTVLHEALRAELLRRAAADPDPKGLRKHTKTRQPLGADRKTSEKYVASDLFRSLRTIGPFPAKEDDLYLPCPADVVIEDGEDRNKKNGRKVGLLSPMENPPGESNMPTPWLSPLVSDLRGGKDGRPDWVPLDVFRKCLAGEPPKMTAPETLFDVEHRIGIGIDVEKGTAAEHQIYSAEHLRLRPGVSLWFQAGLSENDTKNANNNPVSLDVLSGGTISLGGESRMCRMEESDDLLGSGAIPKPSGTLVKWVLATHAVFLGGWLPNWVGPSDGLVLLKKGKEGETARRHGEDRLSWRTRVRALDNIAASLVAACVSKPVFFSGWDMNLETENEGGAKRSGGPKPTMLAVPAGSVYYFKAATEEDGAALVAALHGRTLSDCFGEKGMGLGFCGRWTWESPATKGGRFKVLPSRGELARQVLGAGCKYLKPGDNPIADLTAERVREDEERSRCLEGR